MDSTKQALAQIRKDAERKGWVVGRAGGYWKMKCPSWCGRHIQTMKFTPNHNYPRNLLAQLSRATCWDQEPPKDDQEGAR